MEGRKKQKLDKSLKKSTDASCNIIKISPLNPMVFYPRFPHIPEKIFGLLDKKSLKHCREVAKSWQNCIDNRNLLWNKIAEDEGSNEAFQFACKNGN